MRGRRALLLACGLMAGAIGCGAALEVTADAKPLNEPLAAAGSQGLSAGALSRTAGTRSGSTRGKQHGTLTQASADPVLAGNTVTGSTTDASAAGMAQAYPITTSTTGTVSSISVYVDSTNQATKLVAGLYADNGGSAGSLLTSGAIKQPGAGAWDTLNVAAATIDSGATYWLAVLGTGGKLVVRATRSGSCTTETSQQHKLSSLPGSWANGSQRSLCPISEYVGGTESAPASGTTTTTTTTSTTTTSTTTPTLPPVNQTAPAISGTSQVGQTLSTSNGSWLNSPTSYSYQWEDCDSLGITCSAINGATQSTYTLQSGDVGDTIRSLVTATNAGGSTPASSAQTAVVSTPSPPSNTTAPAVSGTAQQGQTLTSTNGSWTGSPTGYAYAWERCNSSGASCTTISGATQSTYTLASADVNHTIRSVVTATNAGGSTPATSAATAVVTASTPSAPTNSTAPAISGTAQQGQTLTTSNGSWTGSPTGYGYAWERCNSSGASCTTISAATQSTYTLASADVNHTIRSIVTATNAGGSTPATSAATAVVIPLPPTNTTAPAISGTAQQGQTLTTSNGSWTGSPTSYSYAWEDCNSSGASCTTISGAAQSTYTLASADVNHTIRSVVTATNAGGSTPATSAATAVVTASTPSAPTNTTAPAVSGTAQQGQTLTTTNGTWTGSPTGYAYAWEDCNSSGASCTTISGATQSTYTLASTDVGHTIRSVVTATNAGGSTPATSAATAVVTASTPSPPTNTTAPAISGTAQQGQTLTTSNGSWTGSPTGYAYAWEDCNNSGASCTTISGATQSTYTLASADVGDTIRSVVTATNAGGSTPATSSATGVVTAATTSSTFPVKVSSNGRYLETASGAAWLMVGDSPQSLIGDLSESKADAYFADRESHGFNAVWINLICAAYTACNSDGTTYDGIAPFTNSCGGGCPGNYDLADPNPTYFARAHQYVADAEADGIEVILDPIETSGCQGSWDATLKNNGNGTVGSGNPDYAYGAYLGNEFKDLPNVMWQSGNDFQCYTNSTYDADALSVAEGIQSTDPSAIQSLELAYCSGGGDTCIGYSSLDDTTDNWTGVLTLNESYTYSPMYAEDLHAYNQSPTMPMILGESNYEDEQNGGTDGCNDPSTGASLRNCRLAEWWTMTSGGAGQLYGHHLSWQITNSTSLSSLDTAGVTELGYQTTLLNGLGEWYNLVPDQSHTLVTAGRGSCPSTGSIVGVNCVTAAETPDKTLALAYLPDPGGTLSTITVNLAQMAGSTTARWFDPTNGTFTSISGSPFTNSGSHSFTPPGNNSAGDADWVLVLQG
ncbi:MAG TPA: DUF4038 domain-containing protein [Solirubrobacteraceae bacterium]|nr:DUF4038 domain-containing protein [Solirubrobacteraceae bacterium]